MAAAEWKAECAPQGLVLLAESRHNAAGEALLGELEERHLLAEGHSILEPGRVPLFGEEVEDTIVSVICLGGRPQRAGRGGAQGAKRDHFWPDFVDPLDRLTVALLPSLVRYHWIEPEPHGPAGSLHRPRSVESCGWRRSAMFPLATDIFSVDRPREHYLRGRVEFKRVLDFRGLGQKDETVAALLCEERHDPVCQWVASDLVEGVLEDQAVLKLTHDQHLWNRIREPCAELREHVVNIGVDEPVEQLRIEPEPGRCLEEAIGTLVWTSSCWHELPEAEANNPRVRAGTREPTYEIRASLSDLHRVLLDGIPS